MINGKFFSGLTPKMMDRAGGPNRQQSNLFWPDESDVESASESKSRRKPNVSLDTNSVDVEPKNLFKKQLTSKIEFYDVPDETKCPPTKDDNPSGRHKKLETFTSKIQFYDYADDISDHVPKTDINSKRDLEKNSKNSPKNVDKKIKFVEEIGSENTASHPRGILRNNELDAKKKPVPDQARKRLIKKRNLSKSVENLSARSRDISDDEDDCINVIENDVKNIAITDPSGKEVSKNVIDNHGSWSNIKLDTMRRAEGGYREDGWDSPEQIDENFYRKSGKDESHVVYHEIRRESQNDSEGSVGRRQNSRVHTFKMTPKLDTSDDYGSPVVSWPPTEEKTILNNDNWLRTERAEKSLNTLQQRQRISQPPSQPDRSEQSVSNRGQRHLVSNIIFGNDIEATTEKPQKSVRSSAVMRVSVGLPD